MVRPTVISEEVLLSAAREVFLRRGLRATTAEIAEKAGVSQGILFKRFKSKQALFRAAMDVEGDITQALPISLAERVGQDSVEATLRELGYHLVKKFLSIIPSTMMDWSNREDCSESMRDRNSGPERAVKGLQMISDYLKKEVALGRLKINNCEVVAQTFIGAVWHYAFLRVTMGEVHSQPLTPNEYVDSVVQMLMAGIAPGSERKRQGAKKV